MSLTLCAKKLREMMVTTPAICVERALHMTESYKETESDPNELRRVKALDTKKDIEEGRITNDEVQKLLSLILIKMNGLITLQSYVVMVRVIILLCRGLPLGAEMQ